MTTIELKPLGAAERLFWATAQFLGLVTTVLFIIGFFVRPHTALNTLWNAAIPLLPATFLINPILWRNSCPLATLNMLPNRFGGRRVATRHITRPPERQESCSSWSWFRRVLGRRLANGRQRVTEPAS